MSTPNPQAHTEGGCRQSFSRIFVRFEQVGQDILEQRGMSMLYSKSQYFGVALPMVQARKKFKARLEKWPDSEAKMHFILRSELATKAEKSAAGSWLFTHGYRTEDA